MKIYMKCHLLYYTMLSNSTQGPAICSWSADSLNCLSLLHLMHEPEPYALVLGRHHVWDEPQKGEASHDRQSAHRADSAITIPACHATTSNHTASSTLVLVYHATLCMPSAAYMVVYVGSERKRYHTASVMLTMLMKKATLPVDQVATSMHPHLSCQKAALRPGSSVAWLSEALPWCKLSEWPA